MVGFSFYGIFWSFLVIWEYKTKIFATNFSPLFLLHCHYQVPKIITLIFRLFHLLEKMPALDQNVKVTCEKFGTSVTKYHLSRHKSRCSGGILYCPKCPNFSIKSREYLKTHTAKKQSVPRLSTN